jgi:hypothetical protein
MRALPSFHIPLSRHFTASLPSSSKNPRIMTYMHSSKRRAEATAHNSMSTNLGWPPSPSAQCSSRFKFFDINSTPAYSPSCPGCDRGLRVIFRFSTIAELKRVCADKLHGRFALFSNQVDHEGCMYFRAITTSTISTHSSAERTVGVVREGRSG